MNSLGLAWISRIAVDEAFRGRGIGSLMMKNVNLFRSSDIGSWISNFEVMRTLSKKEAIGLAAGKQQDFLTRADFHLSPETYRIRHHYGLKGEAKPMRMLYYYKSVGES